MKHILPPIEPQVDRYDHHDLHPRGYRLHPSPLMAGIAWGFLLTSWVCLALAVLCLAL